MIRPALCQYNWRCWWNSWVKKYTWAKLTKEETELIWLTFSTGLAEAIVKAVKFTGARDTAQWQSTCLQCTRPWVSSHSTKKKTESPYPKSSPGTLWLPRAIFPLSSNHSSPYTVHSQDPVLVVPPMSVLTGQYSWNTNILNITSAVAIKEMKKII
jgi:hypothetical protein